MKNSKNYSIDDGYGDLVLDCKIRVEIALEELRSGRFVIVCDDDVRENEGDLIAAAEQITPELVNFAISEGRGLLCQAIDEKTASYLALPVMSSANNSMFSTAFLLSVDHRDAGTGISASARSLTIQSIGEAAGIAQNFERTEVQLRQQANFRQSLLSPGHIFPLLAAPGGVLERNGQTEATIDLMILAGLKPSGVLCEIIGTDGQMLRGKALEDFGAKHDLCKLSVEDIAIYRREICSHTWTAQEQSESRFAQISLQMETAAELPSNLGTFHACSIEDIRDIGAEHLLFWKGSLAQQKKPLLRIHSECFTGEVLFSKRCDCRAQLDFALKCMEADGQGLVIYLRQEGRGIGLRNKLQAYQIQQKQNLDTFEANAALGFEDDLREYSVAIGVLRYLGLSEVRLLTNNPNKIQALEAANIAVERVPIQVGDNWHNVSYLKTKKNKGGHLL